MNSTKSLAIIVLLAVVGAAAGAGLGSRTATTYEATTSVPLSQVLVFPSWESNSQTARMAHTLRQPDIQALAATNAELTGAFARVSAVSSDGASIVTVSAVVTSYDAAAPMHQLVDTALAQLIQDDVLYAEQSLAANEGQLVEVLQELDAIYDQVDLAPATNLGDVYNSAKFGLESAETQLANSTDDYWLTRLPGDIAANQSRLDAIGPLLDRWQELTELRRTLEDRVESPRDTLAKLGVGESVLANGVHHRQVNVRPVARTAVLGRFLAGGAALGIALALAITAGLSAAARPKAQNRDQEKT